ncbi:MAG: GNAT family N-acetyltransferase [Granulosicoccaceae bacterium]|jgi:predicted GNAT family N-acyltransferase
MNGTVPVISAWQTMTDYRVRPADWLGDNAALRDLRTRVFINEQHVPEALEWDGEDETARHWLAEDASQHALGTVRLLANGHIGRMAVIPEYRGQGIGSALLRAVLDAARAQGLDRVFLHAQTSAMEFYSRHGFRVCSEEFEDAGIPHRSMQRSAR